MCAPIDSRSPPRSREDKSSTKTTSQQQLSSTITIADLHRIMIEKFKEQSNMINEFKASVEFCSTKLDETLAKLKDLEAENVNQAKRIIELSKENNSLKNQIKIQNEDLMDIQQRMRINNIEINGVPEVPGESIPDILKTTAGALSVSFNQEEVERAHRVPSRNKSGINPIVVRFLHYKTKLKWLEAFKTTYRHKLEAHHIIPKSAAPQTKVYINEHLSPANKKLFFEARSFARDNGFKFAWYNENKVMLKKDETSKTIRVTSENLEKLKSGSLKC